jgi:hypothetical protein
VKKKRLSELNHHLKAMQSALSRLYIKLRQAASRNQAHIYHWTALPTVSKMTSDSSFIMEYIISQGGKCWRRWVLHLFNVMQSFSFPNIAQKDAIIRCLFSKKSYTCRHGIVHANEES